MSPEATRACPDCGAPNPLDAETCAECNHPIDPFARRVLATSPMPRQRAAREEPVSAVPGAPTVHEEQGKVIPRRQHQRAGLFGIGGGEPRTHAGAGGAPGWIWAAVGMAALLIALFTAIGITSQRPKIAIEGADAAKLATADSLARILKKNPEDVQANVEMGNVYYDTKNFTDAIGYYDKALARDSSLIDVSVDRAVAIHQAGRPDEAVRDLEAIVARHPVHAIARFDLAVIYEFQGRKADAEDQYRQAASHATSPEVQHVATMRLKALQGTMPTPPPQP
jgi:predicted negative regulator of RcsB-dependent stress response